MERVETASATEQMSTQIALWDITENYLVAEHLELDDLEVVGKGKAKTVRVVVDGEDLDLDRISEVSRGLSRLYDAEYDAPDPYQLEVTSPGLERALKRPTHFRKSLGRQVSVKVRDEAGAAHTHKGQLSAANDESFTVTVGGAEHQYPYSAVVSARTVFRWESAPKPGK